MELEKFARQLRLMVLLTQNYTMTIEEVGQKLCMSRRTIYRYIDAFKNMGFIVKKEGSRYRLDPLSPFFRDIASDIQFSEDEHSPSAKYLILSTTTRFKFAPCARNWPNSTTPKYWHAMVLTTTWRKTSPPYSKPYARSAFWC